jgi:hypothetical protein
MSERIPTLPRPYVAGDTSETLRVVLGEDVSAYLSLEMKYRQPDGAVITKTAVINDASQGDLRFDFDDPDDLKPGKSFAQIKIVDAGGALGTRAQFFFETGETL